MRLSKKFAIPSDLALLYDFVNSLDARRFVEHGTAHDPGDELATPAQLRDWLATRGLLEGGVDISKAEHREALRLREALRNFLAVPPQARSSAAAALVTATASFPLEVAVAADRGLGLRPVAARATSGLGQVLVELVRLSDDGRLERVKTCDFGRMSLGLLRSLETEQPSLVLIRTMRQPRKDPNLSQATCIVGWVERSETHRFQAAALHDGFRFALPILQTDDPIGCCCGGGRVLRPLASVPGPVDCGGRCREYSCLSLWRLSCRLVSRSPLTSAWCRISQQARSRHELLRERPCSHPS